MFGREKYNPEKSQSLNNAIEGLQKARKELMRKIIYIEEMNQTTEKIEDFNKRIDAAKLELGEQVNLGQGEAMKLNTEYSKKIEEATRVIDELIKFESEKLGMHKGLVNSSEAA
jgi:hypothetical protein